jgi:hypothetical protein
VNSTSLLATLCGLALGSVIACGGMAQRKAQPTASSPAPGAEDMAARPGDPRLDEILARDTEIRTMRGELGLPTDPALSERNAWKAVPLSRAIETCTDPPDTGPKCDDVCNLADHICENADEICRIAGELPGNEWAEDKCSSAKVSCKDGKQRRCDCTPGYEVKTGTSAP